MEEEKKPYVFQEFPKHLYLNGDRNAADRVVKDSNEDQAARAEGFRMIGEPAPAPAPEQTAKGKK